MEIRDTKPPVRSEILLLIAFCGFLFFYGLGSFGLLGADEPRYAQIAREMLGRGDWITPTLDGRPWLEKPVLYYWEAMLSYEVGKSFLGLKDGVSEQTARLPGAVDAALMIAAVLLFLRRIRPGTELDGALITACCAGVIGFAHAAATDMPLAASFSIALLGWYDWYENRKRLGLAVFYVFLAFGLLAKGPVAPALAALIVIVFAILKRDWTIVRLTRWVPGVLLFLVVGLPWYVAVQMRNPGFFRSFILEHNLARFSTNVYHHPQPFWFYLPVFLLAMLPWSVWLVAAVVERVRQIAHEGRGALASDEDSWALFLLIWMLVPVLFFSLSRSKLPGYILPAVAAGALLVTDYVSAHRERGEEIPWPLAAVHGLVCGLLVFGALSAAAIATSHHLSMGKGTYVAAAIGVVVAIGIAGAAASRGGWRLLRPVTMLAVVISVATVIRFAAPAIDATQSARPVAQTIRGFSLEPVAVAVYHMNRTTEYGLEFYMDRPVRKYDGDEAPAEPHVLVAPSSADADVRRLLAGRKVSYLTSVPEQKLSLYWVGK